jgi:hypothetical protein
MFGFSLHHEVINVSNVILQHVPLELKVLKSAPEFKSKPVLCTRSQCISTVHHLSGQQTNCFVSFPLFMD